VSDFYGAIDVFKLSKQHKDADIILNKKYDYKQNNLGET
jgi:hypothetical protein